MRVKGDAYLAALIAIVLSGLNLRSTRPFKDRAGSRVENSHWPYCRFKTEGESRKRSRWKVANAKCGESARVLPYHDEISDVNRRVHFYIEDLQQSVTSF